MGNHMKIYIAAPFFSDREREILTRVEIILRKRVFAVFSPREHTVPEEEEGTPAWSRKIFAIDRRGIDWADCLVMLYWGNFSDTGTAWECGYAYATGKPVLVVHLGDSSNLMVHEGSHSSLKSVEELKEYDFAAMPKSLYTGKMY